MMTWRGSPLRPVHSVVIGLRLLVRGFSPKEHFVNPLKSRLSAVAVVAVIAASLASAGPAQAASTATVRVSPQGGGDCIAAACTITQAKDKVRALRTSGTTDITVEVGDGTYRLTSPLEFRAADGGGAGGSVTWVAAPGASPVISGAQAVTGWTLQDAAKGIWVANTPTGLESRQLYVNGVIAVRAQQHIANSDVTLSASGMTVNNSALSYLNGLPDQGRIEFESKGDWTDRFAPVQSIANNVVTMKQPAWDNNTWGWDVPQRALQAQREFTFVNSLSFVDTADEWYLSPSAGKLYYKPAAGVDPNSLSIELPRTEALVSVGGTLDAPTQNLTFRGLTFTGTSWLEPSRNGYANQQNGTYMKGVYSYRPADAFSTCDRGCEQFERARSSWYQEAAAVQVSAATNITFEGNTFQALGSTALGIGNDDNAVLTGVGLAANTVNVRGNLFREIAGQGVSIGGVRENAHHPSDTRMTNSDITLENNTITRAAVEYKDNSGILSTYVTNAKILHNEIANVAYDAIDTGYGWGVNDPGGNTEYANRGYYNWNTKYTTPTTLKNNVVSGNLIHNTKAQFADGGSVYNLSASPGSVFERNYLYNAAGVGLYLDEGTRYTTYRQNVISGPFAWVFTNAGGPVNTSDNLIQSNWYNTGGANTPNADANRNQIVDNVSVSADNWPSGAQSVICEAGVAAQYRTPINANYLTPSASCGGSNAAVSAPFKTTGTSATNTFFAQKNGAFAIRAQGADVWGIYPQHDDAYGAIYRPGSIDGNSSISARVDGLADANEWAKSGVMIRNAADQAGSSAGYAAVTVTHSNGIVFSWDGNGDGYLDASAAANVNTFRPIWVKIRRDGGNATGWYSFDGVGYTQIGSSVALASPATIQDGGIFSTSHDTTRSSVNTFSDVVFGSPAVTGGQRLTSVVNGFAFDADAAAAAGSTVRQVALNTASATQIFDLVPDASGYVHVVHRSSGLAIDGKGQGSGTTVQLQPSANVTSQQFEVVTEGTQYRLLNRATGLALDSGGGVASGSPVKQWVSNGNANLAFALTPVTPLISGAQRLTSVANGFTLEADTTAAAGSSVRQVATNTGSAGQVFTVAAASDGYVRLVHRSTGLVVDGMGQGSGTTVQLQPSTNAASQQFLLVDRGNGQYILVNRATGLVLDSGGGVASGSPLKQWSNNGSVNFAFTLAATS